jgi:hypothetical protein
MKMSELIDAVETALLRWVNTESANPDVVEQLLEGVRKTLERDSLPSSHLPGI